MTAQPVPFFVPNEALTSAALNAAQLYHIDAGRRHRAAAHLPGVIVGLTVDTAHVTLPLEPGYAVDAFGRDLILTEPAPLEPLVATARAKAPQADTFEILLHYQQIARRSQGQAVLDETPRLEVRAVAGAITPPVVNIVAPAPDDPSAPAPVRIGVLRESPDERGKWIFLTRAKDREETGLVAATVVPARTDSANRLELGRGSFAVVLASEAEKAGVRRLTVDQHGVEVGGALAVAGALHAGNALVLSGPGPTADVPGFYRIGAAQGKPDVPDEHELRLILPPQGKLEIGAAASGKFEALLTIDAATRSITIAGDLFIEGAEIRGLGSAAIDTAPKSGAQETKEKTAMETIKGWASTTVGSGMRGLLLLALAFGLLNWDRAATVLLPCSWAQKIRAHLGLAQVACVGNVLFGADCKVTNEQVVAFIEAAKKGPPAIKDIFVNNPDVSVYCPRMTPLLEKQPEQPKTQQQPSPALNKQAEESKAQQPQSPPPQDSSAPATTPPASVPTPAPPPVMKPPGQ